MGTPSTSNVRHRRPNGSRNTAASAVVVTASVAARATAERSRRVNDLPPMTAVTPRLRPSATFTRSPRNRYRLPMRSCSHRRHPHRHQTHLLYSQARVPQPMRVWDMIVGEDAGQPPAVDPARLDDPRPVVLVGGSGAVGRSTAGCPRHSAHRSAV